MSELPNSQSQLKAIYWICAVAVVLMIFGVIYTWVPTYEVGKLHPLLRQLKEPCDRVDAGYYLDGGSVDICVVDALGKEVTYSIPCGSDYKELYLCRIDEVEKTSPEKEFTDDTRAKLCELLERHATDANYNVQALILLRGYPRDYVGMALSYLRR